MVTNTTDPLAPAIFNGVLVLGPYYDNTDPNSNIKIIAEIYASGDTDRSTNLITYTGLITSSNTTVYASFNDASGANVNAISYSTHRDRMFQFFFTFDNILNVDPLYNYFTDSGLLFYIQGLSNPIGDLYYDADTASYRLARNTPSNLKGDAVTVQIEAREGCARVLTHAPSTIAPSSPTMTPTYGLSDYCPGAIEATSGLANIVLVLSLDKTQVAGIYSQNDPTHITNLLVTSSDAASLIQGIFDTCDNSYLLSQWAAGATDARSNGQHCITWAFGNPTASIATWVWIDSGNNFVTSYTSYDGSSGIYTGTCH